MDMRFSAGNAAFSSDEVYRNATAVLVLGKSDGKAAAAGRDDL
jgi:hypothetical protein